MIARTLSLLVPLILVIYFGARARRSPVFLLGVLAILFMGRSAFIDTYAWSKTLLGWTIELSDVMLVGLALLWLYFREVRPIHKPMRIGVESLLFIAVIILCCVEVASTLAGGSELPATLRASRRFVYPAIGYFVWYDILRRFTAQEVVSFLQALVTVAVGLTVLYCAQALGVPVYPYAGNSVVTEGGSSYVRDFLTFSPFAGLALAYFLSHPQVWWRWVVGMAVTCAGFMLTFTRSWIASALLAASIAVVFFSTRRGRRRRRAATIVGIGFSIAVGVAGVYVLSSGSVQAIGARFAEARSSGLESPNLKVRYQATQQIAEALSDNGAIILGAGFILYGTVPSYMRPYVVSFGWGDSTWPGVLAYTGAAGTALFACLLLVSLVLSLRLSARERGNNRLGLMLALVFAQMIVVSFFGDNYLGYGVMPGMFFACLTVARSSLWLETDAATRNVGEIAGWDSRSPRRADSA